MFNFVYSGTWWLLFAIGIASFATSSYLFNFLGTHVGKTILSLITLVCQIIIWYKFGFIVFLFSAAISFVIALLIASAFSKLSGEEEYY
ncbi:MAG: hypothetical protein PHT79_06375 [Syntrophomonadaceae bacterium]|nr:hypothetical protein [Syntrophomonadaceae bacterium]MDD3889105.1 hypothetical protein [Syntrophomonadaceae bacterium]MDD4549370.1 hypothetical protein [Syntrophomonadaceae bacterium]